MSSKIEQITPCDRIYIIRKDKNLSQEEFARSIGFSGGYLKDIERGRQLPSYNIISRLSAVYHVSIDWLLTGEGEMYIQTSSSKEKPLCLGEKWLREYWEQADEQERIWLEVQMKKCFPEFKEWLERQK